jgi:meso-butanediol dehydrogenase / (S,S)-butanediol dehydrogenase / diacetyl reductase
MLLKDKLAVVTGGASGMGRAIAELFASEGARVAIVDRDGDLALEVATQLDESGEGLHRAVTADITDAAGLDDAIGHAVEGMKAIDILVNAAGVRQEEPGSVDLSSAEWDRVIGINLTGTFNSCRAAARRMDEQGGSIINISSTAGLIGVGERPAYAASKHGVIGLTKSLCYELGPEIRVNAICPGMTRTPLTEAYFADPNLGVALERTIPLRRWAIPSEIARPALFLASDMSSYVTGAVLSVDGGFVAEKPFVVPPPVQEI